MSALDTATVMVMAVDRAEDRGVGSRYAVIGYTAHGAWLAFRDPSISGEWTDEEIYAAADLMLATEWDDDPHIDDVLPAR